MQRSITVAPKEEVAPEIHLALILACPSGNVTNFQDAGTAPQSFRVLALFEKHVSDFVTACFVTSPAKRGRSDAVAAGRGPPSGRVRLWE
jgi:hypothetical protein